MRRFLILLVGAVWLAGCASSSRTRQAPVPPTIEAKKSQGGGYYLDDGPGDSPPPNLQNIPDAVPRTEPMHQYANRPYMVAGVNYTPVSEGTGFRQTGMASWYGKRFHGKPTSSGEIYNMYGMTAAHPTLPIPSYARVTSLDSGKSVIVRINDRGPFHSDRVIDLSYTAAYKLGIAGRGSAMVSVESIDPETEAMQDKAPPPGKDGMSGARGSSRAGAEKPGDQGVASDNADKPGYYVQLGAFGNPANAEKLLKQAREALEIPAEQVQVEQAGSLHHVKLGPFADQAEAKDWQRKASATLGTAAITITR
jgi:rare lipoprotein A